MKPSAALLCLLFQTAQSSQVNIESQLSSCESHNDCTPHSHACFFTDKQSTGYCFEKTTSIASIKSTASSPSSLSSSFPAANPTSFIELTTRVAADNKTASTPPTTTASTGPEFGDGTLLLHGDVGKTAKLGLSSGKNVYSIGNQQGKFVVEHVAYGNVLSATSTGDVSFNVPSVHARSLTAKGTFAVDGFAQWRVVLRDVYEGDAPTGVEGWSAIPLPVASGLQTPNLPLGISTDCGVAMLGGPGIFQNAGSITKTFALEDTNMETVRVVGNYHFIDNWSGQSGFLKTEDPTDGQTVVWAKQYSITPRGSDSITKKKLASLNVCGDPTIGEHSFSNKIDVVVPVVDGKLTLIFGSTWELQNEGKIPCAWGISGLKFLAR
jgi:hypothetical protein